MSSTSSTIAPVTSPRGWNRADIDADPNWAVHLSDDEVADFEAGLASVQRSGKTFFELAWRDFSFGPADALALPDSWALAYQDVAARAVRGGFRGLGITPEIETFERRMAQELHMDLRIYADREGVVA